MRGRFTPDVDARISRRRLERLAGEVDEAASLADLVDLLKDSPLPGVADIGVQVERFLGAKGVKVFSDLPETFGIRSKIEVLTLAEAGIDAETVAALGRLGLDPMALVERPWTRLKPSARLAQEFEKIKKLAGGKLAIDRLEAAVRDLGAGLRTANIDGLDYDGRFILNVNLKYAAQVGSLVTATDGLGSVFFHADSASLFFQAADQMTILRALQDLCERHPLFFAEGTPPFTLALQNEHGEELPGIGFEALLPAQRTESLMRALGLARVLAGREPVTWQKLLQLVDFFFQRDGAHPEEPALSEAGMKKFSTLLRYSSHLRPSPVSEEEAAELKDLGLSSGLAFDRRPWEFAEVTPALRRSFDLIFRAGLDADLSTLDEALAQWAASSESYLRNVRSGFSETEAGDWRYAGDLAPKEPFDGRVAVATNAASSSEAWEFFSGEFRWSLAPSGIALQVRCPKEATNSDGETVVYFYKEDSEKVLEFLADAAARHSGYFREAEFPFHGPVGDREGRALPGVSLGDEPAAEGETFVSVRAAALKHGLRLARLLQARGETVNRAVLETLFAFFLGRAGIDPARPSFFRR